MELREADAVDGTMHWNVRNYIARRVIQQLSHSFN